MNVLRNGDWSLKLLALVLAIVIYHTLKTDRGLNNKSHERTFFKAN